MKKLLKKRLGLIVASGLAITSGVGIGVAYAVNAQTSISPTIEHILQSPTETIANDIDKEEIGTDTIDSTATDDSITVETTKPTIDNNTSVAKTTSMEISLLDEKTQTYTVSITNVDSQKGTVTFEGGASTMVATPGQTITLKVTTNEPDKFTLKDLRVHAIENTAINLGVIKVDSETFTFVMPEETIEMMGGQIPNPFYGESKKLEVETLWTETKLNDWTYEFNTKTYNLHLTENVVWDDEANPNLKLVNNQWSSVFRVYMNGFDFTIKNFTVPSGCQVEFLNNDDNTFTDKRPTVSLAKDGNFIMDGVIGRWGSVHFDNSVGLCLE